MSSSIAQVQTLENCTSGLRYGLIEIEPFEEERIVKKFNVRFTQRVRGFKPSESFNNFLRFNTEAVIGSIALPKHLDQTELVRVISEKRIENFESDVELKKALEEIEAKKGSKWVRLVSFFLERQRMNLDNIFNAYAALFLASDLPLSFVSDFTDSEVTYTASLEMIAEIVRARSIMIDYYEPRSNYEKYRKAFDHMKFELSPIVEQIENTVFRAQALRWYILLSNLESVEKVFEPLEIRRSKTDSKELERLHWEFGQDSMKLRRLIMSTDQHSRIFRPLVEDTEYRSHFSEMVMTLVG